MRAMLLGIWKSVEELEESISLPELTGILKAHAEREFADKKFAAALKGIDLPDPNAEQVATFEEVQERARRKRLAKKHGISEEHVNLLSAGIDYEG